MENKNSVEYQEFNKHFPNEIGEGIKKFVTDDVLLHSRYIFVRRIKGVQRGYCTHCQNEFVTSNGYGKSEYLKHNDRAECPKCNSSCTVKSHGISRQYMVDIAYVVYYEKSIIDPQSIIARAFNVHRAYRGDYKKVLTQYTQIAKYLFEPGKATMYENYYWNKEDWHKCKSAHSKEHKSIYANNRCCRDSIRSAIQGTSFQYSTWEVHDQPQFDYVKFFALFSRYPSVEYITKLGFEQFVEAKLFDKKTFGCINWSAKRPDKVLRLSKQELKEVRELGSRLPAMELRLYQISRKDNNRPTLQKIIEFFNGLYDVMETLKPILRRVTLNQIMNYTIKQLNRPEKKRYKYKKDILIAWRDYLNECKLLEMDLDNERVLMPSNLYASHQKTMKLVVHKENEELNKKIKRRVEKLSRLYFEDEHLLIRPAESASELIEEGKKLSICVGGYAERYALGKTDIFLVREIERPDTPFYTVEILNGDIRQVQGLKHCVPTKNVREFMKKFEDSKLNHTKSNQSNKQGVAV
ncbi:PcfJ domain-containing protein [Paenibacillus vandeheii]